MNYTDLLLKHDEQQDTITMLERDARGHKASITDASNIIDRYATTINELTAERDDYKSRWETTGCTRHHAMEIAVGLNVKANATIITTWSPA